MNHALRSTLCLQLTDTGTVPLSLRLPVGFAIVDGRIPALVVTGPGRRYVNQRRLLVLNGEEEAVGTEGLVEVKGCSFVQD